MKVDARYRVHVATRATPPTHIPTEGIMAFEGFKWSQCSSCGRVNCVCAEIRQRAHEDAASAARYGELEEYRRKEQLRVGQAIAAIKASTSRADLIKIASHDQDAAVREAALLRLDELPK